MCGWQGRCPPPLLPNTHHPTLADRPRSQLPQLESNHSWDWGGAEGSPSFRTTLVKALKLLCPVLKLAVPSRLPPSLNTGQTLHTGRDQSPVPISPVETMCYLQKAARCCQRFPDFSPTTPYSLKSCSGVRGFISDHSQ